jgi:hypothetical protein
MSHKKSASSEGAGYWYEKGYSHDPDSLDDPTLIHGAAKHVKRGDTKTGPVVSSIILFKNPTELKDELNDEFREMHQG